MIRSITFGAISTQCTVQLHDRSAAPAGAQMAARMAEAEFIARGQLAQLDRAVSRFRADSELSHINRHSLDGDVDAEISDVFAGAVRAALSTAELTDGLVTPTVGAALIAAGYDVDIEEARTRIGHRSTTAAVASFRTVSLEANRVCVPQGVQLDLGASAKAWAADVLAARLLAADLAEGVLVNLGGDIAVAGAHPTGGWNIGVEDHNGDVDQWVSSTGQAFATSSTQVRQWVSDGTPQHHIIDPRTGSPADVVWTKVSTAAVNAVQANAASTAAVVLGHDAPGWLAGHGIAARLDGLHGETFYTPGWTREQYRSAA